MRKLVAVAPVAIGLLAVGLLALSAPRSATAQPAPDRLVVFETFGREA